MMKRPFHIMAASLRNLARGMRALIERPVSSAIYLALLATIADIAGLPASILTLTANTTGSISHDVVIRTDGLGGSIIVAFPDISDLPEPASGDDSQFVGDLQMALWSTGFLSADPNGLIDELTRDAIRRAEYIVGMEPTGKPTYELFEKLDFLKRNKDLIEKLQEIFLARGTINAQPTGLLDLQTRDAIVDAERVYGLRPDGFPDIRLWNKLMNSLIKEPIDESKVVS